jgi:hypothetical protein
MSFPLLEIDLGRGDGGMDMESYRLLRVTNHI